MCESVTVCVQWQDSAEQRQKLTLLVSDLKRQETDYIMLLQKVLVSVMLLLLETEHTNIG